jgi:hypothetical protein
VPRQGTQHVGGVKSSDFHKLERRWVGAHFHKLEGVPRQGTRHAGGVKSSDFHKLERRWVGAQAADLAGWRAGSGGGKHFSGLARSRRG